MSAILLRNDFAATACAPGRAGYLTLSRAEATLTRRQLSELVQAAAAAAQCPIAVFYLCTAAGFVAAAAFGLSVPADDLPPETDLLRAARAKRDGLSVALDLGQPHKRPAQSARLFGAPQAPVRFFAAMQVAWGPNPSCGLLVVADPAAHGAFNIAQGYALRFHAAQISALLLRAARADAAHVTPGVAAAAQQHPALLEWVADQARHGVVLTGAKAPGAQWPAMTYANAGFSATTGFAAKELQQQNLHILTTPKTDAEALAKLRLALTRWEPIELELLTRRKTGGAFWAELSAAPVARAGTGFSDWIIVLRDATRRKPAAEAPPKPRAADSETAILETTNLALEAELYERKRIETQLRYIAFHDELTGLYNRQYFLDRLANAFELSTADPDFRFSVLFMDLDKFKAINDNLGHQSGDQFLEEVAERLRTCTRQQDVLARVGGDEFALLVEGFEEINFIETLAGRIVSATRQPISLGKQEIFSSCSVGVVHATKHYRLPEEILRDADHAMYHAKRQASGYAIFSHAIASDAILAAQLRTDLQRAFKRQEFFIEYQPVFHTGMAEITGVEALLRWQHPRRGLLLPEAFIAASEEIGLIRPLGIWVLREACQQIFLWRQKFPALNLGLTVNISGQQLKDNRFLAQVQDVLAISGLEAGALQFDLPESVLLEEARPLRDVILALRALGVLISLDDFGTGYSSLSRLATFPLDKIKLDRSLIGAMLSRQHAHALVKTSIELAQSLALEIIAEGLEDSKQLQALSALGCTRAQGFLLGRPAAPDKITKLLAKQSNSRALRQNLAPGRAEPEYSNLNVDPFAALLVAPLPIVLAKPDGDHAAFFVNDAFCRLTGYAREEILGRNCRFLQGSETDPGSVARLRLAIQAAAPIEIDLCNYRKGGEMFWNRVAIVPVFDKKGKLEYFFGSHGDISHEHHRFATTRNGQS